MTVGQDAHGPRHSDPRYVALQAERERHARAAARGTSVWSADQDAAVPREPLRIPELLLGALLAMEAFGVPLGPVALPLNEAGMLLLLALALCRRSRRDVSALGLTADTRGGELRSPSRSPTGCRASDRRDRAG